MSTKKDITASEEAAEQAYLAEKMGIETPEQEAQPQQLGWAWGQNPGVPIVCVMSSTVTGSYLDNDSYHKAKHLG